MFSSRLTVPSPVTACSCVALRHSTTSRHVAQAFPGGLLRRSGGRRRAAEGGKEACLARLGRLDIPLLDMAEAAHLLGQLRDLDGKREILRAKRGGEFADYRLVFADETALHAALLGAAENVEGGAAQPAHFCKEREGAEDPGAVAALLKLAGVGIARGEEGRRQMEFEGEVAFELLMKLLQERAIGVEPRDLVLVLIGHQLEEVARDRLSKARVSSPA